MTENATSCGPSYTSDPVLNEIGHTPLLAYDEPQQGGDVYVKCEFDNPTGSMKDRIALGMISELKEEQTISEMDTIIEASSGNTAGAVALVANRLDHDAVITAPATNSPQKLGYVTAFGAELVTCPDVPSDDDRHYRNEAQRIADERDGVWLDQYSNQMNPEVHAKWTGPEITSQCPDLTHIVAPMGTGGTMSGVAKHIKDYDESITTIGVDAVDSNISNAFNNKSPGEYETDVEGLGKGSELPTMWFEYVDEVRSVSDADAFRQTRTAARDHGLLVGGSAGASLLVALEIAASDPDSTVVSIACDGGDQYFDTIFDDEWMKANDYLKNNGE
jgi:cysteine synthase